MATVDELLVQAAMDPRAAAWGVLHDRACQDGFHEAETALLLARLPDIAAEFVPADRDLVLILAGQLAVEMDRPARRRHAKALAPLRDLAVDWLLAPADEPLFIYRLRAVLALDGDTLWGDELELLVNDEVEIECPRCERSLFVVFGDDAHFATHEDYATKAGVAKTPVLPAAAGSLRGIGQRLYRMSAAAGQQSVANAVTYVFGRATCTLCGRTLRVSDQVERSSMRRSPLVIEVFQLAAAAVTAPLEAWRRRRQ